MAVPVANAGRLNAGHAREFRFLIVPIFGETVRGRAQCALCAVRGLGKGTFMDRQFDYGQKILLAVEFADAPRQMEGMPASYARFKRLSIPDVVRAFDETHNLFVQLIAGRKFQETLEQHMGYWEKIVPSGKQCFVHYAIGTEDAMKAVYDWHKAESGFALLGLYHVEPQSSAYPYSFPFGDTPDHWHIGEHFSLTKDLVFWFNFFPQQPYLFEKTFAVWALFQTVQLDKRGENNQLVASEGKESLMVQGVSEFVQVNLNRFSSLPGFFNSAHEAGKHTFTVDPDYLWSGMLLTKV